jgi:hypothetical protein
MKLEEVCGWSPRAHNHLEVREMRKNQKRLRKSSLKAGKKILSQKPSEVNVLKTEVLVNCAECCSDIR